KPDAVPRDTMLQVLEAGRYSPTGSNAQTVKYIVLEQEKMHYVKLAAEALWQGTLAAGYTPAGTIEKIYRNACNGVDKLFHGAPAVILILDTERRSNYSNAYIAASRIELMAQSLGLGTCYIGLFLHAMAYNPKIAELLALPEGYQVQAVLTIGYPEDQYQRTAPRKPLSVEWR
ncbi:MAG: nitroreductase family protein, partial [Peptococcaceae bacterium]|nr:nitroreductase family protein [Peptococcaceae bacterium]